MGFNIDHHGLQPGGLCQTLPVLDFLAPGRGNQNVNIPWSVFAGTDNAKIQAHLVERKRDVLVGLGFHLDLKLLLGHTTWQRDLLGDHCGRGQRKRDVFGSSAALLDQATQCVRHFVELFDVAIGDPAPFQRLDRTTL